MANASEIVVDNSEASSKSAYIHSIKVPRFYKDASKILQKIDEKAGSLKTLLYQIKHTRKSALYGLITQTLKYGPLLERLLAGTPLSQEPCANPYLAKVLTYELLFGKKYLPGESKPILAIVNQQELLEKLLQDELKSKSTSNVDDLILHTVKLPRYVRINTLLLTTEDACQLFQEEGYYLGEYNESCYDDFLQKIKTMGEGDFFQDFHIPDLLIFHPSQSFFYHYLYEEGKIILQDKASCLPTYLLNPSAGSVTIDACAAPGLKTTHLAALMKNTGTLLAIDCSAERLETLTAHLLRCGVTCGQCECSDFCDIDPLNEPQIDAQYILVDPSCSGSGIAARAIEDGWNKNRSIDWQRLRKLSWFQRILLGHALSFPNVQRVVYSTCSVYPEENEEVVAEVLQRHGGWRLEAALPQWKRRGLPGYPGVSEACLRADTDQDLSNGFFVAVFVRTEEEKDGREEIVEEDGQRERTKKKKKKRKHSEEDCGSVPESVGKKKKKADDECDQPNTEIPETSKAKHKEKRKDELMEEEEGKQKRKQKKRNRPDETEERTEEENKQEEEEIAKTKKKKKKKKREETEETVQEEISDFKKKKKKSENNEIRITESAAEDEVFKKKKKKKKKKINGQEMEYN